MIERISIDESQNELHSTSDQSDGFLVCIPENTTLNDFFTAARVERGSYSASLIKKLYNGLFVSARDVYKEYQKYYSIEYESIEDFLFWKYFVPKNISRQFVFQLAPNEILLYGNKFSIIYTFLETEIMSESLKSIISEIREKYHENTN